MSEFTDTLSDYDLGRFSRILEGIRARFAKDRDTFVLGWNGKFGVLKFTDDKIEMRIEREGRAAIFADGRTEGNFESFTQWFLSASEGWTADEFTALIEDLARANGEDVQLKCAAILDDLAEGK